jgi:hypothetical protein
MHGRSGEPACERRRPEGQRRPALVVSAAWRVGEERIRARPREGRCRRARVLRGPDGFDPRGQATRRRSRAGYARSRVANNTLASQASGPAPRVHTRRPRSKARPITVLSTGPQPSRRASCLRPWLTRSWLPRMTLHQWTQDMSPSTCCSGRYGAPAAPVARGDSIATRRQHAPSWLSTGRRCTVYRPRKRSAWPSGSGSTTGRSAS